MGTMDMDRKKLNYMGLLTARLLLVNLIGVALVAVDALHSAWLTYMAVNDSSFIVALITALLVLGLGMSAYRAVQIGDAVVRANWVEATRLAAKVKPIRQLAQTLPILGMIGTLIGFAVALSGVDQNSVADPSAIGRMVATLMHGMEIAIYTTIVGSIAHVWLIINVRMLEAGVARLKRGV